MTTMTTMNRVLLATSMLLLGACTTSNPKIDPTGEPSFDGLTPLTGTVMRQVWAREDLDLREYTKFMTESAGLQFRPVRSTGSTTRSSATEFPLTQAQQQRVREIVTEQFNKALDGVTRMQRVESPGPGVLRVRGAIIDIVSRVPPERPGRSDTYLDSVGQATFVIELIDSETSSVLVRGVDTRSADTPGVTQRANRVTNTAEVRRLASHWARQLADALNNITELPSLND
jgi:hypothetical protein